MSSKRTADSYYSQPPMNVSNQRSNYTQQHQQPSYNASYQAYPQQQEHQQNPTVYTSAAYQQPQQHYSQSSYSAYPTHALPSGSHISSSANVQPAQTFSAGASTGEVQYPVGHPKASRSIAPSSAEVAYPEGHPKAKAAAAAAASATYAGRTAPYGGGYGDAMRMPYSQQMKATVGMPILAPEDDDEKKKKKKQKTIFRAGGGEVWDDPTLLEWDTNDFRLFVGDIGNEVTEDMLNKAFSKFSSLTKAKIVRDKRTLKSRGYGFLSFSDPAEFARAYREMNGKYVGNRPIKLRKSNWKDRNIDVKSKKQHLKR